MYASRNRDLNSPFLEMLQRNPVLFLAAAGILFLLMVSYVALGVIQTSQRRIISEHLETTLNSVVDQLHYWRERNVGTIQVLANAPQDRELLRQLLREHGRDPATREQFQQLLYPVLSPIGYTGYSVMDLDYTIIASGSQAYIGRKAQEPATLEMLARARQHDPTISRPVIARRTLEGPSGTQPAGTLMQNLCTLVDDGDTPLGYLCLRFDPRAAFYAIFAGGRSGKTGEAYAIDAGGNIISPSRTIGTRVIPAFQSGGKIIAGEWVQVRVPLREGGEGSLTAMAAALIGDHQPVTLSGYRDYRNQPVVGAGRWLPEFNMGVIVEQDQSEAMAPYTLSRNIIVLLAGSAILLLGALTASSLVNRRTLAEREGRFCALLVNIPTPVYMTDLDGCFTVTNPAFCQLTKIHEDDLLGRRRDELPVPRWLAPLLADDGSAQDQVWDQTRELRDAAGDRHFFRVLRFPVYGQTRHTPQALACIIIDVTERMLADLRLNEINQHLERLVEERTAELIQAKEDAVRASDAKAAFLANMSHEIRTPLNAIIGLADVALDNPVDDPVRNYLEKIHASGEHLLHVINDILDISRLEAGKLKVEQVEFSLEQVIDNVVDLVWDRADAKGLELQVQIEPGIPPLLVGDPLRLGQILINFTANAVKFTDRGHVCIRVLQQGAERDRVHLLFEVEDTGIGMDSQALDTLFQPFHQVDSSSSRRFEGSGLGLAICKNLAELMHARIEATSTPGVGSSFRLLIPLGRGHGAAKPVSPAPPTVVVSEPMPGSGCRVLLVEDNPINQELAEVLLQRSGARVQTVENGLDAVKAVTEGKYDLVLMDIQMPEMDGIEATRRIRQLPAGAQVPIIAMTANALPGDKERYLDAGMDDYIAKPVNPALLDAALLRWCKALKVQAASPLQQDFNFGALQQAGIDTEKALGHLMQDGGLYRRLLVRFMEERAELPQQLARAWQAGDTETTLTQVHSLKSLAGSLGMTELERAAAGLERQLREGSADAEGLDQLGLLIRDAVTLVRAWLNQADLVS